MEIVGWLSTVLLALCGLPLAISSIANGYNKIDKTFLWMWWLGELTGLVYTVAVGKYPLIANYSINLVLTGIVVVYSYRNPR